MKKRDAYEATGKVVGFVETESEMDTARSMQSLINSGQAWRLEGAVGRAAMNCIEAGQCMLGQSGHRDFYGSYVPARTEVKEGTKGSYEFVVENSGKEWADEMAEEG